MRFDEKGVLRAINPEAGLFGVAPGTSNATNPGAMDTITRNTLFTNVAETDDGGVYWEGLEDELPPGTNVTDWQGQPWTADSGRKAAHPNSRFCVPIDQVPSLDPAALDPDGVPISAILLGGRRPSGVPLVVESLSWEHGVFMGAAMRSEATSAAEHKAKTLMHDPFAMRPFFGYNFGHYLQHWLHLPNKNPGAQLPKIYGVNWFRKGDKGFLWPGYGSCLLWSAGRAGRRLQIRRERACAGLGDASAGGRGGQRGSQSDRGPAEEGTLQPGWTQGGGRLAPTLLRSQGLLATGQ